MSGPIVATQRDPSIDWNAIRDSYLAGTAIATLAQQYGVPPYSISQRGQRENWLHARESAKALALRELSQEAHGKLVMSVLNDIRRPCWENFEHSPGTDQYDLASRGRERLISCAAKLFGWDRDREQTDVVGIQGAPVIDIRAKVLPADTSTASSDASDPQPANPG